MSSGRESVHGLALGAVVDLPGPDPAAWTRWAEVAAAEDLEGLLYHRCRSAGLALPAEVDQRWGRAYRFTAARTLAALAELERLLAALAAAGIEALVLPGAALLPRYPDPGCRPMDDVDLLAAPGTAAAIPDLAASLGFASVPRHPTLLSGRGLVVDLHDDPLNSDRVSGRRMGGYLDPAEVWQARRSRRLEGLPVQVLGPEDEVLYTAAHAVRHSFRRFTWFLDLEGTLRADLDWDSLRQRARHTGLERVLLQAMRLLREPLGRDLPAPATAWLDTVPLTRWEGVLLRQAFRDRPAGSWGDFLWAGGIAGWGRRCWFLAGTCFPRPAVMLQVFPRLPAVLAPAAYLLRLGQLAWRAARQLVVLLRRY